MSGSGGTTVFVPEGYVAPQGANMSLASVTLVLGSYFPTMEIPLLRGRVFTEGDKEGAPLVVIINHKLAQHYWPGQDPIGKRLRLGTAEMKSPWLTIVGEVADVKQDSPDVDTSEQYYEPVEQYETSLGSLGGPTDLMGAGGYVALRTALPAEQMENALRGTVRSLDPPLPLTQVQTMKQAVSDSEAPRRFNTGRIKLNGYRTLAVNSSSGVTLFSRRKKSLNRKFPNIVQPLADLPAGTIVDGELSLSMRPDAVIWYPTAI
jgi:hypothetical protein